MKIFLFIFLLSTYLFATLSETVHSSISTYYETKSYSNSKQKLDGKVYGVGADIHYKGSEYKLTYEKGGANTMQPPLSDDLRFKKLYLRYAYKFPNHLSINLNYISIIDDNIALTDGGRSYGLGFSYKIDPHNLFNITQYYSKYDDFKVYQSDARYDIFTQLSKGKVKFTIIGKYIKINETAFNAFTKNAKDHYSTLGLKIHTHYNTYHLGAGAYFGKRSFAIMNDGFKIQHHAMEFDRTYAIGLGKTFSKIIFRTQYIYQRAKELPIQNENVTIRNLRFILNYTF